MDNAELLAAVLANPDVLWAAQGARVLGPWFEGTRPVNEEGWTMGHVYPTAFGYVAVAQNGVSHSFERGDRLDREVEAEAQAWCDARLREAGWILASVDLGVKGG